ncbi:MAG: hypothetical protein M1457_01200 [bacterium]|nr:hypothetical protein [bacterium]
MDWNVIITLAIVALSLALGALIMFLCWSMPRLRWVLWGILGVASTVGLAIWVGRPHPITIGVPELKVTEDLNIDRIRSYMREFTSTDSRMTGYPGSEKAYKFILDELKTMGLNQVEIQEFPVAVPIVQEAVLKADTAQGAVTMPIHPLWPNLARTPQTPPEGITASLVNIGKGFDADLTGKRIRDSIVTIDWDNNYEWLCGPEFGAKAMLFRANPMCGGPAIRGKFMTVPANIPRFYVAQRDLPLFDRLLATPGQKVTLHCRMSWERVTARNILVRLEGGTPYPGGEINEDITPVIFHTYYDSISITPDLAPGAEQACGPATLLEMARYLSHLSQRPQRPIYLLFLGAHGQALSGMVHFTRRLHDGLKEGWTDAQKNTMLAQMGPPGLFVGLDLSSHTDRMGVLCFGHFRRQNEGQLRSKFRDLGLKLNDYAESFVTEPEAKTTLRSFNDCINLTLGRNWWTYFPFSAPFDSEVPTLASYAGVTLASINDNRYHVDTPDDVLSEIQFDQLARQIVYEPGRRVGLAKLGLALAFWKGPFLNSRLDDKLAKIEGRVVWLDQNKDYTPNQPLIYAPVFLKAQRNERGFLGSRGLPAVLTDDTGHFSIDGLIDTTGNLEFMKCMLEAYGTASKSFLDANPNAAQEFINARRKQEPDYGKIPLDGSIIYALNMSREKEYPWTASMMKKVVNLNLVCFPCKAVTLNGLIEPRGYVNLRDIQILDASTQSPPFQFGSSTTDAYSLDENCITIWADPNLRMRLTMGLGLKEKRLILINNTPQNPVGDAFVLDKLEGIPSMVLQGGRDMWNLDQSRIENFKKYGVTNPRVQALHDEAKTYLAAAETALNKYNYREYRSAAERGWALEGKAYSELLAMTNDMIRGVLFYLALLLPFSYCIERLVVASGTIKRRIIWMTTIFIASFTILALIHPAFRFTLTPLIVLLAFIILALAVTVSMLVVGKFDTMLQERKQDVTGQHEDTQNVGNIAVRAVDLGIANIRRRPQRGFLTGMTIVLVTFTLLSFTSLVPEVSTSRLKVPTGNPVYKGMLARDRAWNPMSTALYESLKRTFGGGSSPAVAPTGKGSAVAGRLWFYCDMLGNLSQIDIRNDPDDVKRAAEDRTTTATEGKSFTAVALLGMESTEPRVTGIDKTLIAGRWFKEGEMRSIILPEHMTTLLGLGSKDIGRKVYVYGQKLTLVGIYDQDKFDAMEDIDGEQLTPVNFVLQRQIEAQKAVADAPADTFEEYVHSASSQIAIVPYQFAGRIGATMRSIGIRTGEGVDPDKQAEGYARRSNLTILASDGKDVLLYASVDRSKLNAAGQIAIPVLLGFMMVLGTMLGSVYERRREIFVYNSVGLSPTNVASLFLAESSVYAIIGASVGYLLGQVISKTLQYTGALSGIGLNYSAGTTVFVTLLTMFIVLVSTFYPARQAFLAAIPDARKDDDQPDDALTTESIGLYLPFVATPSSVYAMQAYMYEFLDGLQGVTVGQLAIDNLQTGVETVEDKTTPVLKFRAWLAPFDLGISHDAVLRIVYRKDRDVFQYHLTAHRFSGDQQNWRRLTPRFILTVRKQLLMWRILPAESHLNYAERATALFGESNL